MIEQRFRVPESRGEFVTSLMQECGVAAGILLFLAAMICGGEFARMWSPW